MDSTVDSAAADSRVATMTMVAGAAFIVGALGSAATDWAWLLIAVGLALLIYCVPKLHAHQSGADGWAGTAGSWLVRVGASIVVALAVVYLVWEAVGTPGEPDWVGVIWMVGFFAFVVGIVLFAIGAAMSRRFGMAPPLLMLVGIVGGLALDMATGAFFEDDGATTEWGLYIGMTLFGLGLIWIGYMLREGRTQDTVTA